MSSAIPSAKYSCSGSLLVLANGRTAIAGFVGECKHRCGFNRPGLPDVLYCGETDPVDSHRTGDVLEALLSKVIEGEIEFVADLIVDDPRHTNPTRFGDTFQSCGDIHPVTVG
jgi:hypothetical protein